MWALNTSPPHLEGDLDDDWVPRDVFDEVHVDQVVLLAFGVWKIQELGFGGLEDEGLGELGSRVGALRDWGLGFEVDVVRLHLVGCGFL